MPDPGKTPSSMPLSTPAPMNTDVSNPVRKRFVVSGNVQEAGYRVLVKSIARSMGIKGFVRNLLDETVEIVCEGDPTTLGKFLKAIDRKGDPTSPMDINVDAMEETPVPMEGEFKSFKVEYDGLLTQEERERAREAREESMIVGASMLNAKMDNVGRDVREVGQKVDGVGKAVEGVGKKVDSMHSDMNKRFDHMAQRYDLIATSLVKAIDRIDQGFERMDKNSKKTDKAIEQSRKETAAQFKQSRDEANRANKEIVVSNRELAKAVKFMITKLSDKPARKKPAGKRKR